MADAVIKSLTPGILKAPEGSKATSFAFAVVEKTTCPKREP